MPQVAISAIMAGTTISTVGGSLAFGFVWQKAVLGAVLSIASSTLFKPKKPGSRASNEISQRTTVIKDSVAPHRIIYGRCVVGGTLVFGHVTGQEPNKYLHLVIAVSGRRVNAIRELYLNDDKIPLSDEDSAGNVVSGKYAGHARIKRHLGHRDQSADTDLIAAAPDLWTSNHRLRGRAYFTLRLKRNPDIFPSGVPRIKVAMEGSLLYDPRDATQDPLNQDSWKYSTNAALANLDFLRFKNGFDCRDQQIDMPSFASDAAVCEEAVSLAEGSQPRYTCNGSFTLDAAPLDILDDLVSAYAGNCVYQMGKWVSHAGAAEAATFAIDPDDFRGPLSFRNKPGQSERYNAVRGTYVDPNDFWQATDFPAVTNDAYEVEDGNKRRYKDIELPFCIDEIEAQRNAKIDLEDHRQGISATLPLKLGPGFPLRVWQVGKVTFPILGWDEKQFRIRKWEMIRDDNGAIGVDCEIKEYAASIYDWNHGLATTRDPAPNTTLLDPASIGAVSGLALASGDEHLLLQSDGTVLPRIHLAWNTPTIGAVARYEIEYKKNQDSEWISAITARSEARNAWLSNVVSGEAYDVRIRAINSFGVKGQWTQSAEHVVIGKNAPPPDVREFLVYRMADGTRHYEWSMRELPADVRSGGGFAIRYFQGGTDDWSQMTPCISAY
uniref:Fibronectin type III domain-containing protein n=1 Tax=Candidatus Kentrum sp. UNK TaxID=2126344 RepID=A0A451AQF9_9GAMM|nr:MAG: Fibronectin type III domain-containing protein [Candidatus Kentron sp. UNK]VFK68270.1 MAG: Fibronectin type III domain-containing protein [Candidatus Kentron sp. UNK]